MSSVCVCVCCMHAIHLHVEHVRCQFESLVLNGLNRNRNVSQLIGLAFYAIVITIIAGIVDIVYIKAIKSVHTSIFMLKQFFF